MAEGVARLIKQDAGEEFRPGNPSLTSGGGVSGLSHRAMHPSPRPVPYLQDHYSPVKITNQLMSGQVPFKQPEKFSHVGRRRGFKPHRLTCARVGKPQTGSVQSLAGKSSRVWRSGSGRPLDAAGMRRK